MAPHPTLNGVPRGRIIPRALTGTHPPDYYLYVPRRIRERGNLLVSVHGTSRNGLEHALLLADLGERLGVVVAAPLFRRKRHRGYQRLARREGRGEDPLELFERVAADARRVAGLDEEPLALLGFSGGGQFAHRYALMRPERVSRLVVAAAGWYTLPTPRAAYPLGIASSPDTRYSHLTPRLAEFLRIPTLVVVGSEDDRRDAMLNRDKEIDASQGTHRVQRAQAWHAGLQRAAAQHGLPARSSFALLQGVGHSFAQAVVIGGLEGLLAEALAP
ncbi:MAG: hypothetical protein AAF682_02165 [Planctomycetota bacterium]